ncbi:nuclear transport factor 2 family protein [Mucilaginibacter sp.]|uniref:YybH family protein n=1 Tax=Mucilaginibacter sp. TaxID=1882438 RepID=UPI0032646FC8
MKRFFYCAITAFYFYGCAGTPPVAGNDADKKALAETSRLIGAAFAKGDVKAVMKFHHPDVVKGLSYGSLTIGRDSVEASMARTFKSFRLEFIANKIEDELFEGNTATQISSFTIKGTPIAGGQPFIFKGRAMVVYIKYKKSPTGWASIREVIQPAP